MILTRVAAPFAPDSHDSADIILMRMICAAHGVRSGCVRLATADLELNIGLRSGFMVPFLLAAVSVLEPTARECALAVSRHPISDGLRRAPRARRRPRTTRCGFQPSAVFLPRTSHCRLADVAVGTVERAESRPMHTRDVFHGFSRRRRFDGSAFTRGLLKLSRAGGVQKIASKRPPNCVCCTQLTNSSQGARRAQGTVCKYCPAPAFHSSQTFCMVAEPRRA